MASGVSTGTSRSSWGYRCYAAFDVADDPPTLPSPTAQPSTASDFLGESLPILESDVAEFLLQFPAALQALSDAIVNNSSSLSAGGDPQLQARLTYACTCPLTRKDLVDEGLDFHCDWNLIKSVIMSGGEQLTAVYYTHYHPTSDPLEKYSIDIMAALEDKIKAAIWTFRSSTNSHRLWKGLAEVDEAGYAASCKEQLEQKKYLAPLWRVVGSIVNAYVARKLLSLQL